MREASTDWIALSSTFKYRRRSGFYINFKASAKLRKFIESYEAGSDATAIAATDVKDTILGDLAAKKVNSNKFNGDIVTVTESGGSITGATSLTIDDNGLVKEGDAEVGCIMVQFDIDITATQVD